MSTRDEPEEGEIRAPELSTDVVDLTADSSAAHVGDGAGLRHRAEVHIKSTSMSSPDQRNVSKKRSREEGEERKPPTKAPCAESLSPTVEQLDHRLIERTKEFVANMRRSVERKWHMSFFTQKYWEHFEQPESVREARAQLERSMEIYQEAREMCRAFLDDPVSYAAPDLVELYSDINRHCDEHYADDDE